jgi:gamma-glutamyltranspeptidase
MAGMPSMPRSARRRFFPSLSPITAVSAAMHSGFFIRFGQTQFLAQTICNLFDFDINLQAAVEAPRWQSESVGCVEPSVAESENN